MERTLLPTKLSELYQRLPADCELHADGETEVTGISCDSRTVRDGELFAAVPGAKEDGAEYIASAAENGAACVLCEAPPPDGVPYILTQNVRRALALAACAFYGDGARRMTVIGVTGTNGKTTTTFLLKQLLESGGAKVGLIGTNQNMIGDEVLPASRTTPDAVTLQKLLRDMAEAGCRYAVMEVSSHALAQHRVDGIRFRIGVFTNLTQDHLDYHETMEDYCAAKARLFRMCDTAIVNGDDPWCEKILAGSHCETVRFGRNFSNDIVGWKPKFSRERVHFTVCDDREQRETSIGVPGEFSLYNALGALACARELGMPLRRAAQELARCHGVKGRAEVVPTGKDFTVLIDYAHTPDGLANILSAVNGFADDRVIAVFGCGGDRDRSKRTEMGRIAAAMSDLAVLTSDNPRTEDPYAILRDVLAGILPARTPFAVIEDRREAIAYALRKAQKGDVVLLAGKGHETYQIVGERTLPLDEREVVRNCLNL